MKIKTTERPLMPLGLTHATITSVEDGLTSEYQGTEYINVHLENDAGALEQRFYLSDSAQPILAEFIQAIGLDTSVEQDTQNFVGRKVQFEVEEHHYTAPNSGNERAIRQGVKFAQIGD